MTFIMNLIARIKFWLQPHPFIYDDKTSLGYAYKGYNIFRDEVCVRLSHRGYVTDYAWWTRESYLEMVVRDKWDAL
jgi:hypothetical protein